jgi:hypothetical protein
VQKRRDRPLLIESGARRKIKDVYPTELVVWRIPDQMLDTFYDVAVRRLQEDVEHCIGLANYFCHLASFRPRDVKLKHWEKMTQLSRWLAAVSERPSAKV